MTQARPLWPYSVFAGVLAAAGLPIYIHAPKFYVDSYGVELGSLGAILAVLRLLDLFQDPLFGLLSARLKSKGLSVAIAMAVLAAAMVGLFAVAPPFDPLVWFAVMLVLMFSAYSFLTITFYAAGVSRAESAGRAHLKLAGWREGGALVGVCLAAIAPVALVRLFDQPFSGFAAVFSVCAGISVWFMTPEWSIRQHPSLPNLRGVLEDANARWLLLLGIVNAAPVAVTSTLFLFFVESRLASAGSEGPLLVLFFVSAAVGAPIWSVIAQRIGPRAALLIGMGLSVAAFLWALSLDAGDVWPFAAICVATGVALGADMTILPAAFAARMARVDPQGAAGFGLWSFATKASLALAAAVLLPLLQAAGFRSGGPNSAEALGTLSVLYAGVPCVLKLCAIGLLTRTPMEKEL
ncbi:MFS transporter [Donghicola sp. XS_ASV15]|uniref:MFS transporter n=1 Tax=Donghicola sp. XS_ASV15 TaxID=3241295 RepID=UPI003511FD6A